MGRKPNAAKLLPKSSMPKNMNPSLGESEPSFAREGEKGKYELEQNTTSHRKRKSRYYSPSLKISQRKTPVLVTSNDDIDEIYVEDFIVSENENDKTDTQVEEVRSEPEANLSEPGLKEKVDCILQQLEAHEKTIESLQVKLMYQICKPVDENIDLCETPSSASAQLIEALREENRQLTGKLENSQGQVEVLEKQLHVLVELLERWKDVVITPNLSKSSEALVNELVQVIQNACASYGGK